MGRTLIIGDVHGCAAELEALLGELAVTAGDRVVFVGDLVARGPDSRGVLARARALGARSVRGNHEERLLAARDARARGEPGPRLGPAHRRVLEELDDEDWAQLESLPLSLDLPEHDVRVVHAGVVPGVPFEEQDPWLLTHIRTIDAEGIPSNRFGGALWGERYDGGPHVVFGHNARLAPQLHPHATGIDTGCVYGGRLTAMVLEDGQKPPAVDERAAVLFGVSAKRTYVDYGGKLRAG